MRPGLLFFEAEQGVKLGAGSVNFDMTGLLEGGGFGLEIIAKISAFLIGDWLGDGFAAGLCGPEIVELA